MDSSDHESTAHDAGSPGSAPGNSGPIGLPHASARRPQSPRTAPPMDPTLAWLLRTLYSHNPFYVASAGMVFWGLRSSFDVSGGAFDTCRLALGLAGYTLLLAATAYLVIRYGKVWDDARSLLLLVVLMFLGISVSFDGMLADRPSTGVWYYLCGWVFSVAVSESAAGRTAPALAPALSSAVPPAAGAVLSVSDQPGVAGRHARRPGAPVAAVRIFAGRGACPAGAATRRAPGTGLRRRQRLPLALALVSLGTVRRAGAVRRAAGQLPMPVAAFRGILQ